LDAKAEAHCFCLLSVLGAEPPALYLRPEGAGWALPDVAVMLPVTIGFPHNTTFAASAITAAVRTQFGLDSDLHLIVATTRPGPQTPAEVVVLLGVRPEASPAHGLQLVAVAEARHGAWSRPDHQALLDVLTEPLPAERVSWARPGFLAEAGSWITERLAQAGLALAGPLEVRRNWSLSLLLRVPTTGGDCYFKAVPALFRQEPGLTAYLAQRFPGRVPAVLAFDADRHWLLMRGFDGSPLMEQSTPAPWIAALEGYAALQVTMVPEAARLLALGCPDRRASVLEGQVAAVLADTDGMLIDRPNGLSAVEAACLAALGPALRQACRAFAALPLPATLEHGDLHGNNIVTIAAGGCLYFDWTDGCLAPPFFGLPAYLETGRAEWHAPLIAAYSAAWQPFTDALTLDRARRLARPLSDLHMALSYSWIRAQTEARQRWQLAGSFPFFLRELLKHWAELEPEL
jgi:hypothetical protein